MKIIFNINKSIKVIDIARDLKKKEDVEFFIHPAQSSDLNPQEKVWNLLKQRVRKRGGWKNKAELKALILEEWEAII